MNDLDIAKIQNTINEIENQTSKIFVDTSVSKLLMTKAVSHINLLLKHLGYIEHKLKFNVETNNLISELLNKYINYYGENFSALDDSDELLEWVKNCPECAVSKIEILQMDLTDYKSIIKQKEAEISRLENELARAT